MITLQRLQQHHLQQCTTLFMNVFNAAPWNDEWTEPVAQAYLQDFYDTPKQLSVVALDGDEIVGFLIGVQKKWWSGDEFFVHELCVANDRQQQGIGKQLLNYLIEQLPTSVSNITLLTDRGVPAEAFYKKNGFEEIERIVFLNKNL